MDILSFILGIALVVVIGLSIVAVIAFVKVREIEKQIVGVESDIYRKIQSEITETHRIERETNQKIDDIEREVYSQMDSRLDKLENKLITKK